VIESMFQHFVVEKIMPPVEVLHIQSIIGLPYAGRVNRELKFPSPYRLRNPEQNERICFPRGDEVGVYCDFFSYGFCFPLDKDVEALLTHYRLLLCQHSPTAIRVIMAFISLTRNAQVPFSVGVFRYFYQLRISPGDVWATIVARPHCKLVLDAPSKVKGWKKKYVFVRVPQDFPLKRRWVIDGGVRDRAPTSSEEIEGYV